MPLDIEAAHSLIEKYNVATGYAETTVDKETVLDKAKARLASLLILPVGPTIAELKRAFRDAYPDDTSMHDLPMSEILAFSELVKAAYQQVLSELS